MTDREVFEATMEHRRPDRILYYATFTPDLQRRVRDHVGTDDVARHYGFFEPADLKLRRPAGLPKPDYSRYWHGQTLPEGTTFDAYGVAMIPSGFYHFWGYLSPLRDAKSIRELETYPLDDYSQWDFAGLAAQVQHARAAGKVTVGWVGHMYETAWQIRGYEQFLVDLVEQPAWSECLLERLFQQNLVRAKAFAAAGADYLTTGDDVASQKAMMFSVGMWRELMLSRWSKVWAAAKLVNPAVKVWYHSDGDILSIVEPLVQAGVDILNPLQPECLNIDAVHARLGTRASFDGCIGTQSTMPHGSPDDVRARVKDVTSRYGRSGGLIVSPTHILEPEVPLANIDAFADACREYGQQA